jgi:hypothetical protein
LKRIRWDGLLQAWGKLKMCRKIVVRKSKGKRSPGRHRCNVKMDLK